MNVLRFAGCLFGSHHRNKKRAWRDGTMYRSICSGCGQPMVRTAKGWQLDDATVTSVKPAD